MEDLTELKQIWASMPDRSVPDFRSISLEVKKYRTRNIIKKTTVLLFVIILGFLMGRVVIVYESQLISTRIGEGLMIIAIGIMLSYTIRSLRRLAAVTDLSNEGFLKLLKDEQLSLFRFEKRTQVIGYIAASFGLLLYLYEGVKEKTEHLVIGYTLTLAWITIIWFIVKPRVMKKKMDHLHERIENLERISQQLKH
ncbi:MAG TPA: hypothetical protein VD927_09775 [Chryseosolibacter sp.]|nr:hypothetical protein [Chryseosolibacter sp.]